MNVRSLGLRHSGAGPSFRTLRFTAHDVAPGYAVTEFHFARAPDPAARKRELEEMRPDSCLMQRLARPHEVAAGIAFLASEDASYVTGTTLCIDGGRVGLDTRRPAQT